MAVHIAAQAAETLLVRQPIFNRQMKVFAYQLLYQNNTIKNLSPTNKDHTQAICKILINALATSSKYDMCIDFPIFISVTNELLASEHLLSLPPEQVIFDISDPLILDSAMLNALKHYQKHQFRFAIHLDLVDDNPLAALAWVDYIRINVDNMASLNQQLQYLKRKNHNAKIIAQNIDTQEQLAQCRALDIDLLQGHFLCRPCIIEGHSLNFSQISCLRLIGELESNDITPARIAELLSQSPQLSFKLLRLINSATYELSRTIDSLREAVIYLGIDVICHWASLMVLTESSDKPKALVMSTLVRAKMAELLAKETRTSVPDQAFLVGLFSTIDAMLDIQMQQALKLLPLSEEINQALLNHQGPLGQLLYTAISYEQGQFDQAKQAIDLPGYRLFIAYGEAVLWTKGVLAQLFD